MYSSRTSFAPYVRLSLLGVLMMVGQLVSGCDMLDLSSLDPYSYDSCASSSGNSQVAGSWIIEGRGSRYSCSNQNLDGDFLLHTQELQLRQIDHADSSSDSLELATPLSVPGGSFMLRGTVRGTCVEFTIEERGTSGDFFFEFSGTYAARAITGSFTGSGPPGCQSNGTFRIDR